MSSQKFVVSRNYRDLTSKRRWLVRKWDDPIEKAVAYHRVIAKGVKFEQSNRAEKGFGCHMVAVCDEYEGQIVDEPVIDPKFTKLTFTGWEFQTPDQSRVESVNELNLDETGDVLAVL